MTSKPPGPEDDASVPTTYNLLYVCTGNTCRSPMARAIMQRLVDERGWSHVSVDSAGAAAAVGSPASENAIIAANEAGTPIDDHRAKALSADMLEWADLVLVMSPSQLELVTRLGHAPKVALATDFLEGVGSGQAVRDPFGGPVEEYRETYEQLRRAAESLVARLEPILSP